eukprot:481104_1
MEEFLRNTNLGKEAIQLIKEREVEIDEILHSEGVSMSMKTAPKIRFNTEKHEQELNKLCDAMKINDCDEPKPMQISLHKVDDDVVRIKYALHKDDVNGAHKIVQIALEYALLNKRYSKLRKPKAQRKKRKRSDSSDSDSSSDSEDSNSTDDEDAEEMNIDD